MWRVSRRLALAFVTLPRMTSVPLLSPQLLLLPQRPAVVELAISPYLNKPYRWGRL